MLYKSKSGQVIQYVMYMNDKDSSYGQIETDTLTDEYIISTNDIAINVKEYTIKKNNKKRYVGDFEYKDAQYQLMGTLEKEEFNNILKKFIFFMNKSVSFFRVGCLFYIEGDK